MLSRKDAKIFNRLCVDLSGATVIARDLAQANFIKKGEGESVYLTPHGIKLVEALSSGT